MRQIKQTWSQPLTVRLIRVANGMAYFIRKFKFFQECVQQWDGLLEETIHLGALCILVGSCLECQECKALMAPYPADSKHNKHDFQN